MKESTKKKDSPGNASVKVKKKRNIKKAAATNHKENFEPSMSTGQNNSKKTQSTEENKAKPVGSARNDKPKQDRAEAIGKPKQDCAEAIGKPKQDCAEAIGKPMQDRPEAIGKKKQDRSEFIGKPKQDRPEAIGKPKQDRPEAIGKPKQDRAEAIGNQHRDDGKTKQSAEREDQKQNNSDAHQRDGAERKGAKKDSVTQEKNEGGKRESGTKTKEDRNNAGAKQQNDDKKIKTLVHNNSTANYAGSQDKVNSVKTRISEVIQNDLTSQQLDDCLESGDIETRKKSTKSIASHHTAMTQQATDHTKTETTTTLAVSSRRKKKMTVVSCDSLAPSDAAFVDGKVGAHMEAPDSSIDHTPELQDFKSKLHSILQKNEGKMLVSNLCNQFKEDYGKNIRKWLKSVKVGRVMNFLQENCSDMFVVDNRHDLTNPYIYDRAKLPKDFDYSVQVQEMTVPTCEEQLKRTVLNTQGSSKSTAIDLVDSDQDQSDFEGEGNFSLHKAPVSDSQRLNMVKKKTWNIPEQTLTFNVDEVVSNFHLYRDFQMLHVAYSKFRVVVMFTTYGKTSLSLQQFSTLFKGMFREKFFSTTIMKYYVSDGTGANAIKSFLMTFCSDFLQVKGDSDVYINGNLPVLHERYLNELILRVKQINAPEFDTAQHEPTPAEVNQLGMEVAINNKPIDVSKITDRRGNLISTVTDFPHPENRTLRDRERPSITELNEHVNRIRNKICREGRVVTLTEILGELCAFYKVSTVRELKPEDYREIRRESDIPGINDIIRLQGKVNAFIQAFVHFRNICTLHELENELSKMEGKSSFVDLRLGPLQKQFLVYHFFQFPPTCDTIPAITTLDVFRLLWKLLDQQFKEKRKNDKKDIEEKLSLKQFLIHLTEARGFNDPYESGVKIGSIGLAVQVVRRAFFGDIRHVRESVDQFFNQLCIDFDQLLSHTAKQVIRTGKMFPGDTETLIQRISGMPVIDAFQEMYTMLKNLKKEACKTLPGTAHLITFSDMTKNALSILQKDPLMCRVFHVLLSTAPLIALGKEDVEILKYLGFKQAIEEILKEEIKQSKGKREKERPAVTPKGQVMEITKKWILKIPQWDLSVLSRIETRIALEVNNDFDSFDDLGHGSFLKFITTNKSLYELVDMATSTGGLRNTSGVGKNDIIGFVNQCDETLTKDDILTALQLQYHIDKNEKQLQRVVSDAFVNRSPAQSPHIRILQTLLCGTEYHKDNQARYPLDTTCSNAKKRIQSAPYLHDIAEWTNWEILYQSQLGGIKEFIQKEMKANDNVMYLEVRINKIVKILKDTTTEEYLSAIRSFNALMTSTYLVSILNSSGHINNAPIALLSNHMQHVFLECGSNTNLLLKFCLECFSLIPFEVLCCVVNKIFLDPLSQVVGRLNVMPALLNACTTNDKPILHALGVKLSIQEWLSDYEEQLVKKEEVRTKDNDDTIKQAELVDDPSNIRTAENIENGHTSEECRSVVETDIAAVKETLADKSETGEEKMHVEDKVNNLPDVNTPGHSEGKQDIDLGNAIFAPNIPDVVVDTVMAPLKQIQDGDSDGAVELTFIPNKSMETEDVSEVNTQASVAESSTNSIGSPSCVTDPCHDVINIIRREQFGIGETFGEKGQKLIDIHREREGRALNRLSKELYTKDSHFVLELIQNADDNEYPEDFMTSDAEEKPTVVFVVEQDKVTIFNNEVGFQERNIRALCDVGKSTKGAHRKGYIGQKGIGFKSVFRVTDTPEIHSNGYHIKFDASSGPNGYILPEWIDDGEQTEMSYNPSPGSSVQFKWTTKIVLPLKVEMQHLKLTSRFHDIHPSLLMFLNRLHKIIIDDKVSGTLKVMCKERLDDNIVRLSENKTVSLWFTVTKEISMELREDVKTTDISVAFPIQCTENKDNMPEILPPQPVFAFLPLRSYGFKFVVQADFDVPSSREDIDKDSPWNQCILQRIPDLVVDAFRHFKVHSYFNSLNGVIEYFKFMDLEDHVLGIFKHVARQILQKLQREPCLPVQSMSCKTSDTAYSWKVPQLTILSKEIHRNLIPADVLHQNLGLFYIHSEIQHFISNTVYKSLGVENLSLEQLVEIAKSIVYQHQLHGTDLHEWIGRWFYIVSVTMQESCDFSEKTIEMIKSLKIFPLCDGSIVSLKEQVIFFPVESQTEDIKATKSLRVIEHDLCILSHAVLSNLGGVEQQHVHRLLQEFGVKTMVPHDLIHNYIIPLFNDDKWKDKPEDVIVACVTYLRLQFSIDEGLFSMDDIKEKIVLKTNKGFKNPAVQPIYLPKEFGNDVNLEKDLSACDWTIVSLEYSGNSNSAVDRSVWKDFFLKLGLKMFACIQEIETTVHKSDLIGSVWSVYSETWPQTQDDTYVIKDYALPEFTALLKSNNTLQCMTFAMILDRKWIDEFQQLSLDQPKCIVKTTKGEEVAFTYSSFLLEMRKSAWIRSSRKTFCVPSELFFATDHVVSVLDTKVNYISTNYKDQDFMATIGVRMQLTFEYFISVFKKWREEKLFSTTYLHVKNVYLYMKDMSASHPKVFGELLESPFFFLLTSHCNQSLSDDSIVEGKFLLKKDVCWNDPSGIMIQSKENVLQRRILRGFYNDNPFQDFFVRILGVDKLPSAREYLNLISNLVMSTVLPNKQACKQIYTLFSTLSWQCVSDGDMKMLEDWSLPNDNVGRASLYNDLSDYVNHHACHHVLTEDKIFPESSNRFVAQSDQPILVMERSTANIFKKDGSIPLVFFDDVVNTFKIGKAEQKSTSRRNEDRFIDKKLIKVLIFFKAFGLPLLQDILERPEPVPEMPKTGFQRWQKLLHDISPYVQRYLKKNHSEQYERLEKSNFATYLNTSVFFEVKALDVIHRLKERPSVNIKQPKACHVLDMDGAKSYIYITSASETDKKLEYDVIFDLMELFVGPSENLKDDLAEFVMSLVSTSKKEDYLRRKKIPDLSAGDSVWIYPKPLIVLPPPPKPLPELAVMPIPKDTDERMTCWPPKRPGGSGIKPKPESVKEEEKKLLEQWTPPEAPLLEKGVATQSLTNESQGLETKLDKSGFPLLPKQKQPDKDYKAMKSQREHVKSPAILTSEKKPSDGLKRKRVDSGSSTQPTDCKLPPEGTESSPVKPKEKKPFSPIAEVPREQSMEASLDVPNTSADNRRPTAICDTQTQFDPTHFQTVDLLKEYEDLAIQLDRNIDTAGFQEITEKQHSNSPIGRIGEAIVYNHLRNVYKDDIEKGMVELTWLNNENETGEPYDIEITYAEELQYKNVYIEVKSTHGDEKKEFEISSQQLKFAIEKGACFHLYRLSGVRTQKTKLKRLVNLAMYMDNKAVKLYMLL